MRPLRLKVRSFTAFREEQEIDLEELGVFAIAGPTGSGKSSLLDAMTFALYGYVERVGKQVGQLVSQGQPRMAVTLEFAVGDRRYRVTRSTPASKGQTKVLLERFEGGEWEQAGEGSDRVHDCNALIRRIVGLDYTGFTRSVLLPQGKFAEFLVGDIRERRDILVDLLGLGRFRRMGEIAGQIGREEGTRAEVKRDLLERDYGEVTAAALAECELTAREARRRERALGAAGKKVDRLLERWDEARRAAVELRRCAAEAGEFAAKARGAEKMLEDLAVTAGEASDVVASRRTEAEAASGTLETATAALAKAEAAWGKATAVAALHARAVGITAERRRGTAAREAASTAEGRLPALGAAVEAAERVMAEQLDALVRAGEGLAEAERVLRELRHADQVAALVADLSPGDPCPVCGDPLETIPDRPGRRELVAAGRAFESAGAAIKRAERAVQEAERARDRAARDLDEGRKEADRLAAEAARLEHEVGEAERLLAEAFGGHLPLDPVGDLEERLSTLEDLGEARRQAADLLRTAEVRLRGAESEREGLAARIASERGGLTFATAALVERAGAVAGKELETPPVPSPPESDDPAILAAAANAIATTLEELAARLEGMADRRAGLEPVLLSEARDAVGDLLPPPRDLASLAVGLSDAIRHTASAAAATEERARSLSERLEKKRGLEEEVRAGEARATTFKALSMELRADRIIDFLLREALAVLAAAASIRLRTLSGNRYRLECRADEFYVVDIWNGDETRSVRTLSGGETFLASLALALALSEQVRSLSVTERARLDSLFLDEGFGTLDPETLKVVIEAIEALGGDGRLVGVITHVPALAEEFPRFDVTKTPRGSHVAFAG